MPRKAILMPYSDGQNEPSKPYSTLIELSDDSDERTQQLTEIYTDKVFSSDHGHTINIAEVNNRFGDIVVYAVHSESAFDTVGSYLYATYID